MVRTVLGGSCPPFAMVYWRMFMSYWWAHPNRAYLYITSDQLVCDLLSFGRFTETHLLAPPTQLPRSWRFRPKSWSLRSTTCQLVDRFVSHEFRPELPFDHGSQASWLRLELERSLLLLYVLFFFWGGLVRTVNGATPFETQSRSTQPGWTWERWASTLPANYITVSAVIVSGVSGSSLSAFGLWRPRLCQDACAAAAGVEDDLERAKGVGTCWNSCNDSLRA